MLYYLEMLDKLQKQLFRTIGTTIAASFEPLGHRRNLASFSLFYRYYFGRCSSELAELVPLPYSRGRSTHYSDKLCDFSAFFSLAWSESYFIFKEKFCFFFSFLSFLQGG